MADYHLERAIAALEPGAVPEIDIDGAARDPIASLKTAMALCKPRRRLTNEPIRTLHQLSCTGGTMLAKCIASMSNVLLLNEIDFTSPLIRKRKASLFSPTDMVSLIRQGDENADADLIRRVFVTDISLLLKEQANIGRVLVLRDHSHSHFLTADSDIDAPTLYETVTANFDVKSLVSVRDPIDSYASMVDKNWHKHFLPSTFDEYCRRYLIFLDRHEGAPIVKYEDFVIRPQETMKQMCGLLALDYFSKFADVFDSFDFSGDSGRRGATIEPRERRELTPELKEEIVRSEHHRKLCERLVYDPL